MNVPVHVPRILSPHGTVIGQHISARADKNFPHKPSDVRAVTPQDRKSAGVFIISIDSGAPEGGEAETLAALGGEPLPVLSTSSKHSIPCP